MHQGGGVTLKGVWRIGRDMCIQGLRCRICSSSRVMDIWLMPGPNLKLAKGRRRGLTRLRLHIDGIFMRVTERVSSKS